MTLENIKDILLNCAEGKCKECHFVKERYCQATLIKKMGEACEKLVIELGDDLK